MTDYISIDGRSYRVEANWNAIISFLEATGRDNMLALSELASLKPSDLAGLMASCIIEGERLEGRECHMDATFIGSRPGSVGAITEFISIYIKQTTPAALPDDSKKKD